MSLERAKEEAIKIDVGAINSVEVGDWNRDADPIVMESGKKKTLVDIDFGSIVKEYKMYKHLQHLTEITKNIFSGKRDNREYINFCDDSVDMLIKNTISRIKKEISDEISKKYSLKKKRGVGGIATNPVSLTHNKHEVGMIKIDLDNERKGIKTNVNDLGVFGVEAQLPTHNSELILQITKQKLEEIKQKKAIEKKVTKKRVAKKKTTKKKAKKSDRK
jgi:hypothetical protein